MRLSLLPLLLFLVSPLVTAQPATSPLITQQWLSRGSAGDIEATIVGPAGSPTTIGERPLLVTLASQDGQLYRAEPTGPNQYTFTDVPGGVYTLVARGPGLVACYAVHFFGEQARSGPDEAAVLEIAAANLPVEAMRGAAIRYMPASVPPVAELDLNAAMEMAQSGPIAGGNAVAQVDGGIAGRIYRAGISEAGLVGSPLTNVMIFREGEVVAQATTAEDGSFVIQDLPQGLYSVLAVGPAGVGITSLQVVGELLAGRDRTEEDASDRATRLVNLQGGQPASTLQLQLAPAGMDSPAIAELIEVDPELPAPLAPPELGVPAAGTNVPMSRGGFGGGGGGGGLGGGGLGGLLGIAGVGAGIAAATSDDDDALVTPPVTSPATP